MDSQVLVIFGAIVLFLATGAVISLWLMSQREVSLLTSLLATEQQRVTTLTNLVASRDPMTYATLQSQTAASTNYSPYEPYSPVGTDEDEWKRQQELLGRDVNDYTDDLNLAFGGDGGST